MVKRWEMTFSYDEMAVSSKMDSHGHLVSLEHPGTDVRPENRRVSIPTV
ncbi:predicted protein [Sclerotinia sclerotiorum 1980 UF-70]|uniref:Uncharacterized protein n=1 Tax=Sclerotinia sclerotiorum (strain ATCC 18683 / 1980 / Ss-1) TaxID=665079 RepID=A7F5P0_SCLS1|nr:predicted protein [Sclerotinia sclerotiorum 1980 UF-70]EDN98061.1 predicted protein [Sclerotinia sclerotiorum 1980 UF-70]